MLDLIYSWYTNATLITVVLSTPSCTCCVTTTIDFITEDDSGIHIMGTGVDLFLNIADLKQDGDTLYTTSIWVAPLT